LFTTDNPHQRTVRGGDVVGNGVGAFAGIVVGFLVGRIVEGLIVGLLVGLFVGTGPVGEGCCTDAVDVAGTKTLHGDSQGLQAPHCVGYRRAAL
jgi:hypothetical protein